MECSVQTLHLSCTQQFSDWLHNLHIVPKEVCKVKIKTNPPKPNQEKESGVTPIENRPDVDN